MLVIKAATEENLNFRKEAAPEVTIKAVCKSDKEVEIFYKEIIRFIRRAGHIKKQKVNYEIVIENLENRTTRIIRNKRSPREVAL